MQPTRQVWRKSLMIADIGREGFIVRDVEENRVS